MLERLVIHDVVLIEKLVLQPGAGLNVFTGETGAGKSILLDALGLALGERSEAGLIRTGATQASVTAEFNLPETHKVLALAREHGLAVENPLILRRLVGRDGKSRAFVNDQPVSIALLKTLGENLIEIHGQFETYGLLNPASHRALVDACAVAGPLVRKTGEAFKSWRMSEDERSKAIAEMERTRNEEEFLRLALDELDELAPKAGETADLSERRNRLQSREKIVAALDAASQALAGDRGAAISIATAGKTVSRIADKALGLPELLATIDRAADETAAAAQAIDRFMSEMDTDPKALERIEERLFALRASARKHNTQPDALAEIRIGLKARLDLLSDQNDETQRLAKAAAAARHTYITEAEKLSARRRQVAQQLEKAVMKELAPLKLQDARFQIEILPLSEDRWSQDGTDKVTFLASMNQGTPPGPLHKVASGGELSRFMLALRVVLAAADPVPVLVFDEIDAGIGGATASAVGERLKELSRHVQILVVTHSPQVAARGAHHLKVAKQTKAKKAVTDVEALDVRARLEEIARMLAGSQVTDAARQAAASLMEDQDEAKKPRSKTRESRFKREA